MTACSLTLLVVLLAGCSENRVRPSETLPTTSEVAVTSESPTPAAVSGPNGVVPFPTPSAESEELSGEGAFAFNEYWIITLDYLYATLDVQPFREASSPECRFCDSVLEQDGRAEAGYVYVGGRITIMESALESFDGTFAVVGTVVSVTELIATDPEGNPDPASEAKHPRYQFFNRLAWDGESWAVVASVGTDL